MPENKFGRRQSFDPRDRRFMMREVVPDLSSFRPWRYYDMPFPLPLDQGRTGTCVAHAWVGFLRGAPIETSNAPSPFTLYREFVLVDEWTDNDAEANAPMDSLLQSGTSVRAGAKVLQHRGHIAHYVWAASAQDCALFLLSGKGTVVMGTDWYEGMEIPDPSNGLVRLTGRILGGHSWLLIGYNRLTRRFRALNSWSRAWGINGRFSITHEDLDRLIGDAGEACSAVEQLVRV